MIKGIYFPKHPKKETTPEQEVKNFIKELEQEFGGLLVVSEHEEIELDARLNARVHEFKQYMKIEYPDYALYIKIDGDLAYYTTTWTVEDICTAHRKYCQEYHIEKEEYTRMEINNMLFDLQELYDVIRSHSQVAMPYSACKDYNEQIFDGVVEVECRYYWEDE